MDELTFLDEVGEESGSHTGSSLVSIGDISDISDFSFDTLDHMSIEGELPEAFFSGRILEEFINYLLIISDNPRIIVPDGMDNRTSEGCDGDNRLR